RKKTSRLLIAAVESINTSCHYIYRNARLTSSSTLTDDNELFEDLLSKTVEKSIGLPRSQDLSMSVSTNLKFRPGDIIIDDLPYAASVSCDSLYYVCSMCFGATATEACDGCQKVVYCNSHCKDEDYYDHYYECGILAGDEDTSTLPDEELRLVIRALTRYLREKDNPSVGDFFGRKRTINDLLSHVKDLNEEELADIHPRIDELMALIGEQMDVSFDLVLEMLMKCRINSYCIMDHNDPNFFSRGRALYLAASAVDHTCADTDEYAYMFDGRRFILRSMANFQLKDPSTLRVQYMPTTLPYEKRRKLTLSNYFFLCSCSRCVTDARVPFEERQQRECDEELANEIDNLFTEQRTMQEWFEGGTEVLKKFADIPVTDFYHFWVLTRMQVATHEMGHFQVSSNT
ncbi:SET and MYND domain-containing protein 1-like, partial [Tropilaelaps mercedesae]